MPTRSPNWTPHYAGLRTRLHALRHIFPIGSRGETCCALFDEFLEHREFDLALDVLCDFLLEPDVPAPAENEFQQIASLHLLMQRHHTALLDLRDKFENSRKASDAP
jgi:hypothetical protein